MNKHFYPTTLSFSKKYFLVILICLSTSVAGQSPLIENVRIDSTASHTYRVGGIGIGVSTMRDALLSPVRYHGFVVGGPQARWEFRHSGWLHQTTTQVAIGADSSSSRSGNLITSTNFSYSHTYLKPFLKKATTKLYAGPYWEGLANLRTSIGNTNNVLSYDIGLGIGAAVLLRNHVRIGELLEFDLHNQLSSIVVGAYVRPQYNWSLPVINEETDKVYINLFTGFWNVMPNLDYQLSTDFYLTEYAQKLSLRKRKPTRKVAYRLTYHWQYRSFLSESAFKRGQTMLQFGPIIKL